jgi:hypothetical protein
MVSRKLRLLISLVLLAALLVSCKEDDLATTLADGASAPISDSTGDEGSQAGGKKPTPRTELSATNPGSVRLGSGRVTLVEFFAYW